MSDDQNSFVYGPDPEKNVGFSVWSSFHTEDAEEAHAHLSRAYMEISVRRFEPEPKFSLHTLLARLGSTVFGRAAYTGRSELRTVSFEDPCFVLLQGGRYRINGPAGESDASIGGSVLLTPYNRLDLSVDDFRLTSVTIPRALVEEMAEESTGRPDHRFRFESGTAISPDRERQWVSTVAYLQRSILAQPELVTNDLIVGQAQRLLAAAALDAFPNTAMTRDAGHRNHAEVSTVRRAVAFIEARLADDLSVSDIAQAARVDAPTLHEAFRVHLDTTPTAYLRRARMDMAHRDLAAADPQSETVALIARRWGFADPRAFAAEYLGIYGRLPSETFRS